jgi:PQQ-like domain
MRSILVDRRRLLPLAVAGALIAFAALWVVLSPASAATPAFNHKGNVLIADQFNNRVIEVATNGHIVWHFGTGSNTAGAKSVVAPNDAQRIPGGRTLIAGTGAPPGVAGYPAGGAPDSRVLIVNQAGKIVWQYGKAGVPGTGKNRLDTPVQATYLPGGNILITDQANARVIMVNPAKQIVWQYGKTGVTGSGANRLNNPNSAELLKNGHILIADEGNNRVIEVTRAKKIVWSVSTGLNAPAFASRLPDGHTLIADGGNNRVVEVDQNGAVVWSYDTTARAGSVAAPAPSQAVRLKNGDTLISDQFNDQVIEVTSGGTIAWSYGQIGQPGSAPRMLYAPYSAKVIGDYTGLTPPTGF